MTEAQPDPYDGANGYWYGDKWHHDEEDAIEAWWEANYSNGTRPVTREQLAASASGAFRRGVPVEFTESKATDFAIDLLDRMEEDHYCGAEVPRDHDVPTTDAKFQALVAAIRACAESLTPLYDEGEAVDLTAECMEWIADNFDEEDAK